MTRHIVLGNQQLLVNIDEWMQVRDLFFPHVGQFNHLRGNALRVCILEGDKKSWLNDAGWSRSLGYEKDTLVSVCTARNDGLQLGVTINENVYCEQNIFFRRVTVKNDAPHARKLRVAFHNDLMLYGEGVGDTAFHSPQHESVVHYKRAVYLLLGILGASGKDHLTDYDIGEEVEPGWDLPQRPIAQGRVRSVLCKDLDLAPGEERAMTFYVMAGTDLEEVYALQEGFVKSGAEEHLEHSRMCQRKWVQGASADLSMIDDGLREMYRRSLLVVKTQMDRGGAIIAANDSDNLQFNKDTYSYLWPRDGALVAIALIRAGFAQMTRPFFEFCRDVLYKEGCLLHKYNPDKTLGSSWHPWIRHEEFSLPIQEDETALVLHALWVYYERTQDAGFIKALFEPLIRPMSAFLKKYRYGSDLPRESYDLWEERRGVFTFTTAAVIAGLRAGELLGGIARDDKLCTDCNVAQEEVRSAMIEFLYDKDRRRFRRSVTFEDWDTEMDDTLDSSAYAAVEFGAFKPDDPLVVSTMKALRATLWIEGRGLARYENDTYFDQKVGVAGNPWIICTLWYAKWLIRAAKKRDGLAAALDVVRMVQGHALPSGLLSEQVHPVTGEPLSVCPLTWSHAEFVDTITLYAERWKELQ